MESAPTGVRKNRHKQEQTDTNRKRKGRGNPVFSCVWMWVYWRLGMLSS